MTTLMAGEEGFIWFFGVVEDREDPLQIGRVRVRIYNHHNPDKNVMPTESLQWASVMQGITSSASMGIGVSPTGLQKGSHVVGFFLDAGSKQMPFIIGSFAGIPEENDVAKLARGENSIEKKKLGPEPETKYGAKYPFNKTITTESGHVIEIDDTPNKERIHIYHKTGTYIELNPDGGFVQKTEDSSIEVVTKDKTVYVGGNLKVEVRGSADVKIIGDADVRVGGDLDLTVIGDVDVAIVGDTDIKVAGDVGMNIIGDLDAKVGGDVAFAVNGDADVRVGGAADVVVVGDTDIKIGGDAEVIVAGSGDFKIGGDAGIEVAGNMRLESLGPGYIKTAGLTIDTILTVTENVIVGGDVVAAGEVTGNSIELSTHKHGGVQTGGGMTATPT